MVVLQSAIHIRMYFYWIVRTSLHLIFHYQNGRHREGENTTLYHVNRAAPPRDEFEKNNNVGIPSYPRSVLYSCKCTISKTISM